MADDQGAKRRPCPICGRPAEPRYRPFCSRRCAEVDLGRWLGGDYAIPAREDWDEDERPEGPERPERPGPGDDEPKIH